MTATTLLVLAVGLLSTTAISPAAAQTCAGDCNGDQAVGIDEIIVGVRIALGAEPTGSCLAMDGNGDGVVTVNDLIAAVTRALQGCSGAIDEAAVEAAARVATEPLFRLFDFQAHVGEPGSAHGRSIVSGCQQFDCVAAGRITGTEEDCCTATEFTQVFDNCTFDNVLGTVVSLNGSFALNSDDVDICTGAIPSGASFTVSLSNVTRDIFFTDGTFFRTFQDLSETFDFVPGGCSEQQPDRFAFGIRGDGQRRIDGKLQQFESDGAGNLLIDSESIIHDLAIAVSSTQQSAGCSVNAALRGSVTGADLRSGTQFTADLTDLHVVEVPGADSILLEMNGTVDSDCRGNVSLSTSEPLRLPVGGNCFTAGLLEVQSEETASVIYTPNGLDFDFGTDGGVDPHFTTCTDVPANSTCNTSVVGLCRACSAMSECQTGLSCFPCSRDCTGTTGRCSPGDTFVTCEDGIF